MFTLIFFSLSRSSAERLKSLTSSTGTNISTSDPKYENICGNNIYCQPRSAKDATPDSFSLGHFPLLLTSCYWASLINLCFFFYIFDLLLTLFQLYTFVDFYPNTLLQLCNSISTYKITRISRSVIELRNFFRPKHKLKHHQPCFPFDDVSTQLHETVMETFFFSDL